MTGEGARRFGGRWTSPRYPMLYTAEHPALAGFERRIHAGVAVTASPLGYRVAVLSMPDDSIDRVEHVPDDPQGLLYFRTPAALLPMFASQDAQPERDGRAHDLMDFIMKFSRGLG